MKAAIIAQGKVTNIAEATQEFADSQGWIIIDALDPQPQIGWGYEDGVFVAPEITEDISLRNNIKVYRRAFRLALQQTPYEDTNLLVAIEAQVSTLDPYDSTRMAWSDVTLFERNHPDMSMFSELGLTDEQIDDIFRLAESVEIAGYAKP